MTEWNQVIRRMLDVRENLLDTAHTAQITARSLTAEQLQMLGTGVGAGVDQLRAAINDGGPDAIENAARGLCASVRTSALELINSQVAISSDIFVFMGAVYVMRAHIFELDSAIDNLPRAGQPDSGDSGDT
jgi:hypothetical protein